MRARLGAKVFKCCTASALYTVAGNSEGGRLGKAHLRVQELAGAVAAGDVEAEVHLIGRCLDSRLPS